METEYIALEKLIPYENNARKNDKAVKSVAKSLQEFGWQQPIVCD
ncbi:MAG: ParB N-terminal domain-containing protein, partial [Nanoarchaeota archaeon]|nr:ParB N-terminal domain-containing protein [Nanoarchaeota archaeon]